MANSVDSVSGRQCIYNLIKADPRKVKGSSSILFASLLNFGCSEVSTHDPLSNVRVIEKNDRSRLIEWVEAFVTGLFQQDANKRAAAHAYMIRKLRSDGNIDLYIETGTDKGKCEIESLLKFLGKLKKGIFSNKKCQLKPSGES